MQKNGFSSYLKQFFTTKNIFTTKNLIIMGMLVAVAVVLDQFTLFITPQFKAVSFSYLPGVIVAALFGPWAALAFGFVSDTVKFLINSHGGMYFPGYALSEMLSYFVYAIMLYKQPIKVWRIVAARVLILVLIVLGLNFLWQSILSGTEASKYFTGTRLINNLVQLPFHTALIYVIHKTMRKVKPISQIFAGN